MKNLFSFWRLLLCVVISLLITSCSEDKDDADDNSYEVGADCGCADTIVLLTNKIEEMEVQLEEYKSEIDAIQTQLNIFNEEENILLQFEKYIQKFTFPKVLSSENYTKEEMDGETRVSKTVADYEFDEQGRIVKITLRIIEGRDAGMSDVTNVTYDENKCTIESVSGILVKTTERLVLTFDDDDISNIAAVNNLIVSVCTER